MGANISLIAAVSNNGVIGSDGGMPWRLSTDLKRFKSLTLGKPIIMGRKTFESIGKPLSGRANIVVSGNEPRAEGIIGAKSVDEALAHARRIAEAENQHEICVIGGGQIYNATIDLADRLYITHIQAELEGDTYFPEIECDEWIAVSSEDVPCGEGNNFDTRFVIYKRNSADS